MHSHFGWKDPPRRFRVPDDKTCTANFSSSNRVSTKRHVNVNRVVCCLSLVVDHHFWHSPACNDRCIVPKSPHGIVPDLRASVERCALSGSVFCNQYHTEPCFALHHPSVSIRSPFERKCLDHRTDVLQDTEGKSVLAVYRRAGQASIDGAPAKHERECIQ